MIKDARKEAEDAQLKTDVCVVGGGAAGITLALELARQGKDVILLEAGGGNRSGRAQQLYKGKLNDKQRHLPLDSARYRQLGGTTSLWGGRCIPFDAIDFEPREYVPHSGWPIQRSDLDSYYQRAHHYCECGDYNYDSRTVLPDGESQMIPGLEEGDLVTTIIERWSPPTRFGKKYRQEIKHYKNIRVYLHAVVVGLDQNAKTIRRIKVRSLSGKTLYVSARFVVLASGGMENARLLMASKLSCTESGESNAWLGAGYMSHIHGVIAQVHFTKPGVVVDGYEEDKDGVYCRRRLGFSAQAQRQHKLLNTFFLLDRPLLDDPTHSSALLSLAFLAKRLLPARHTNDIGSNKYAIYWSHLKNVLSGSSEVISFLPGFSRKRFLQSRRLPSMIVDSKSKEYSLYFQTEQIPNLQSRLTLDSDSDELGVPKLKLDFQVTDIDVDSILHAHQLVDTELRKQGCGYLVYAHDDIEAHVRECKAVLAHHIGTTRMGGSNKEGVVDVNCRVFGLSNLYVAGPSVFPTCSRANPMLTIVALAIRLADYLGEHLRA